MASQTDPSETASRPSGTSRKSRPPSEFDFALVGPSSAASRLPIAPDVRPGEADDLIIVASRLGAPAGPDVRDPAERYQLRGMIARGGMGAILKGRDTELKRDIAIKVLLEAHRDHPELVRRFLKEAQIAGRLQHPGVVPVYELGQFADGRPYFTMKLVEGRTLAGLLAQRTDPAQDRPRLLKVFEQVCQTLAYAHSKGVIHRDLKPSNVMVGPFGEVQVMDWGLAKELRPAGEGPAQDGSEDSADTLGEPGTQPGSVLGTPAYMPPEQARGEVGRLDERSDVFGLGAILCEVLTGQPPYTGPGRQQVARQAVRADLAGAYARLSACGAEPELIALARACLAAKPEDRPPDAEALASALTGYLESVEARLRRAEMERAATRAEAAGEARARRWRAGLMATAALGLLTGAGLALWLKNDRDARLAESARLASATEEAVRAELARAEALRRQGRWDKAHLAAERAGARLGREHSALSAGVADELEAHLRQARDDLDMVERLEEVRMWQAESRGGHFDYAGTERAYRDAFAAYGLRVEQLPPSEAAGQIKESAIRQQLVAGLDYWLFVKGRLAPERPLREAADRALARLGELGLLKAPNPGAGREHLQEVADLADPDPWRRQLRDPVVGWSRRRLEELADRPEARSQPPTNLALLGRYLRYRGACDNDRGAREKGIEVLRRAQRRHPADFWLNMEMALALLERDVADAGEAAGFYRAALALRPRTPSVYNNLGAALLAQGKDADAEEVLRQALDLQPGHAPAATNLGRLLTDTRRYPEAEALLRQLLRQQPDYPEARLVLGLNLQQQGRFADSLPQLRRADERLRKDHPARPEVRAALDRGKRLAALEARLPAVLHGAAVAADGELLALAEVCSRKDLPASACRLYARALAPGQGGEGVGPGTRYDAACCAARAGCGRGKDNPPPDGRERARWRKRAVSWLRADLERLAKAVEGGEPAARAGAARRLRRWQADPYLAGLRDPAWLDMLPAGERDSCRRLWAEVGAVLAKARRDG